MHMFLFQAIQEFAKEVAKADPDAITNSFIDGHSWIACAKHVLAVREAAAAREDDQPLNVPIGPLVRNKRSSGFG